MTQNIALLPTNPEKGEFIEVTKSYSNKRYSCSVVPVTIVRHDGYTTKEFGAYTGYKSVICTANRFSRKQWDAITSDHPTIQRMVDKLKSEI